MRVCLIVGLLATAASAVRSPPLRVNNRLHTEGPDVVTPAATSPTEATTDGAPTLHATRKLLATNPGMHRLNEMVMTQVFSGLENEVVCTFCLLQVLSLAYQLGNSTVRGEMEAALDSPQPGELGDALLWAASAETKTLAGTLLGYYQTNQQLTCDRLQQTRLPGRGQPLDPDRCQRIEEFVSDVGRPVDFAQPNTTRQINAEVSRATGGRIAELFPPLPADTKLVFVSALVFQDFWRTRMVPVPGVFRAAGGDVPTEMLLLREELPVLDGRSDGVIGVSLPYQQPGVSMFVFTTIDGSDIRQRLSQQHYERLTYTPAFTYTRVTMPSFDIESKKRSYIDLISGMGMSTMFDGGMGADDQLEVAKLVHKAVIQTDKDGTQAAGAAGIAVVPLSAKPQPFQAHFDHPFVCSLVHAELGAPIFTTYVANPQLK